MIRYFAFLMTFAAILFGQHTDLPSSAYPALDTAMASFLTFQTGAGAPSAKDCTIGKDVYTDTTSKQMYICTTTGTPGAWTKLANTKTDVSLGNVDNTSDANKPVSTATQTALDLKAPLASPSFTGVVTASSGFSGILAANLPAVPTTAGANASLTGPNRMYVCTTTCTVIPPTPVAGYQFCVRNAPGVTTIITLAAIASSFYEKSDNSAYGTVNSTFVSGGAVGDSVCLLGLDATHYLTVAHTGTWTAN